MANLKSVKYRGHVIDVRKRRDIYGAMNYDVFIDGKFFQTTPYGGTKEDSLYFARESINRFEDEGQKPTTWSM